MLFRRMTEIEKTEAYGGCPPLDRYQGPLAFLGIGCVSIIGLYAACMAGYGIFEDMRAHAASHRVQNLLQKAGHIADTNNDGIIDNAEWARVYAAVGKAVPPSEQSGPYSFNPEALSRNLCVGDLEKYVSRHTQNTKDAQR